MSGYRKNSFVIDCSVLPARPKMDKLKEFIFDKLQLTMNIIKNVQTLLTRAQAIIEVESPELVEQIVAQHNLKHTIEHENNEYFIPLFPADDAIEVKVSDLPPHMPNNIVAKYFAPYGEILSIKNETWKEHFPGLPNCVRILRMRLRKAIPSYVAVDGEMSYVMYRNQVRTCRHCANALHIGRSCADARKEHSRDLNARLTAAQIVQGIVPPPASIVPSTPTEITTPSSDLQSTSQPKPNTSALPPVPITEKKFPQASSLPVSRSSSTSRIPQTTISTQELRNPQSSSSSMEFNISEGEIGSQEIISTMKRPGSPPSTDNSSRSKRTTKKKL